MTNSEYDSYISSRSSSTNGEREARYRERCNPISMKAPIMQDEFYDMRFCGIRGGEKFLTAKRPVETIKNGKSMWNCPDGTVACST